MQKKGDENMIDKKIKKDNIYSEKLDTLFGKYNQKSLKLKKLSYEFSVNVLVLAILYCFLLLPAIALSKSFVSPMDSYLILSQMIVLGLFGFYYKEVNSLHTKYSLIRKESELLKEESKAKYNVFLK
jgi:hypothetical protein